MTDILEFDISEPSPEFHEFLMSSFQIENLVQYKYVYLIEECNIIFIMQNRHKILYKLDYFSCKMN